MSILVPDRLARGRLGLAVGLAALTAVQGLATVATKSERWVGHWPSSSAGVTWANLWGTCLAAGAAAWLVAAPRRGRYQDMLLASSRCQARVYQGGLAGVAAGSLAGYGVVLAYVVWSTTPRATYGHLDVLELLATVATVPLAVGVGAAAGRVVPPLVAPVLAAITPLVVYMALVYADAYGGQIVVMDFLWMDQVDRDYLRLPAGLLVSRAVLWGGVGAALLAWALRANRVAYASAVAAGLAVAVLLPTAGARVEVPSAYAATCFGGRPRVCVDRAHDHLAGQYRRRVLAGLARIHGLDVSSLTVVQRDDLIENSRRFTGSAPDVDQTRQIAVPMIKRNTAPAHEIGDAAFTANLGFAVLVPCFPAPDGPLPQQTDGPQPRPTDGPQPRPTDGGLDTATILYDWWLTLNGLPTDGSNYPGELSPASVFADDPVLAGNAERFKELSSTDRAAWFTRHSQAVLSCTAQPSW